MDRRAPPLAGMVNPRRRLIGVIVAVMGARLLSTLVA